MPAAGKAPPAPQAQAQCWECLRRHWVCDAARPVCNRCRDAGIVCPGFSDRKPLTWLAPGRVSARPRRQRGSSAVLSAAAPVFRVRAGPAVPAPPPSGASSGDGTAPDADDTPQDDCFAIAAPRQPPGSQAVSCQRQSPASRIPAPLPDDMAELLEALFYYNSQMYPNFAKSALAPSPFVAPMSEIHNLTPSMRHAFISMALGHRILNLPDERRLGPSPSGRLPVVPISGPIPGPITGTAGGLWWRLHNHAGSAIRALKREIAHESTRYTAATIHSVFALLIMELFQSASPQWRLHNDGFMTLVRLRGGIESLIRDPQEGELMRPGVLTFILMNVMANTTSPSHNQVAAASHANMFPIITELLSTYGAYPRLPCPTPLFFEIVRINHLRQQLSTGLADGADGADGVPSDAGVSAAVQRQLEQVVSFSPEEWAAQQDSSMSPLSTWLLVGQVFHSAVVLYAEASLAEAEGPALEAATRALHRGRLFELVAQSLASEVTKYSVMWPLIVAGFEAASGTRAERAFVVGGLHELCHEVGATTLAARDVLTRFWTSGKTRWDECFDRPYALLA